MNQSDPNRLSSIVTFLMHCDAQHPATIERIEAIYSDEELRARAMDTYALRILEAELSIARLYDYILDAQLAALRFQDELDAEAASLRLIEEALKNMN